MQRILILGAGFAGLWAAAGAARALDALGVGPDRVEVTLVNRDAWHGIRVRNYEADLDAIRVPLATVLDPIGVRLVDGEVTGIDLAQRSVRCMVSGTDTALPYDRLVFALGSGLARPAIPGLAEHGFDIDTFAGARRLADHLAGLDGQPASPGRDTVLVVGAGLTGIEAATEMVDRIGPSGRVILADHAPQVGSDMGDSARPVIETALAALGVETRMGVSVAAVDAGGATLSTGEVIPAATVIWCAGMRASPLTAQFPVERDRLGRLPVDPTLKIIGLGAEFAVGDSARAMVDDSRASVMSCQHSRPMGRFGGHNVVADLLGQPLLPMRIEWYTTILDLGSWGAVYTEGWDRQVAAQGAAAKQTKQIINRQRIYPPLTGDRRAILDAAAPVIQAPPQRFR
ncbi:NADH dehydrogenase [Inquilinus ginsengisoli]|uniref:NADH dehydrogenase n=1 Tax=Inquilinus ginsengisoli TaxID=363840 RepID=A0ABU1JQF0_9PROT|nr:FAD-dependent oxidoreductase [Inquilinus ginsengisoli]MDR6290249.1 NADH dehydrogenase [Inquilinus ginsengisoli]